MATVNGDQEKVKILEDRERFIQHLQKASEEVRAWPVWKQNLLGWMHVTASTHPVLPNPEKAKIESSQK